MAQDQMMRAKELIQQQRYGEARAILVNVDHPTAREWIAKIDNITAQAQTAQTPIPAANPYGQQQPMSAGYGIQQPMSTHPTAQPNYNYPPAQPMAAGYPATAQPMAAGYEDKPLNALSIPLALIGGIFGALLGGAIWAAIVYVTDYQLGYAAMGVGALAGFFAVLFSGGRRGIPIQIIAVLTGLLGVGIGKYAADYLIGIRSASAQIGQDMGQVLQQALKDFPPFSPEVARLVFLDIQETLQPIDLLFVVLAIFAAWRIASGRGRTARR
jgi:hypothetical protein